MGIEAVSIAGNASVGATSGIVRRDEPALGDRTRRPSFSRRDFRNREAASVTFRECHFATRFSRRDFRNREADRHVRDALPLAHASVGATSGIVRRIIAGAYRARLLRASVGATSGIVRRSQLGPVVASGSSASVGATSGIVRRSQFCRRRASGGLQSARLQES